MSQKLVSWNVNGIRSALRQGLLDFWSSTQPDIFCFQEIKAQPNQLDPGFAEGRIQLKGGEVNYHAHWNPAQKPGYSGVATFTKAKPIEVFQGLGIQKFDAEGRVLTTVVEKIAIVNAYFPNSQRDHARLGYKLEFCAEILKFCKSLEARGLSVVLCGDYNIAHQPIDLANPKTNENNAGYLPEERNWMEKFLDSGFSDIFRELHCEPGFYTWWSNRPEVRDRNIGWRLDYHCISQNLKSSVKAAYHESQIRGSDHCPVVLEFYESAPVS